MFGSFIAVSAVMPSLLIGWYFHKRDLYPEPPRVSGPARSYFRAANLFSTSFQLMMLPMTASR